METLQVDYDPERISYEELLKVFFSGHNPAWPSPSRQYASAVFYHDMDQKRTAEEAITNTRGIFGKRIFTELLPYSGFTRAEDYHQKYYLRTNRALVGQYKGRFPDEDAFTDSTAVARVNGYLGGHGTLDQLDKEKGELGISEGAMKALREILGRKGKR